MNEYEIYIVDNQEVRVDKENLQSFKSNFPNAILKQDFQTPTTPGAVVEETAAPDMDSSSVDTSLESPEKFNLINTALGALFTGIKDTNAGQVAMRAAQTPVSLYASIGKMYNAAVDKFGTAGAETGLRFITNGIQLFKPDFTEEEQNALIDKVSEIMFEPFFETIGAKKITEQISGVKAELDKATFTDPNKTITEEFASGNFDDAIQKLSNGVMEAVPSVAAAFAGPIGYGALFASASGDAYDRKIEARGQRGDLETFAMSLGQGGVEMVSEVVTRGIFKGFGGGVVSKLAPEGAKNLYKSLTKNLTGRIFTGATIEGLSEVGAQETNRFIDAVWDDENVFGYRKNETYESGDFKYDWGNILTRSADTFMISSIIGGVLGGTRKTDAGAAYINERLSPTLMKQENLLLAKRIGKLEAQYQKAANPIIEKEIFKLKKQILNNKKLNERTLELFNDNELAQYAAGKVAVSQAKEGLKDITDPETKKLIENSIQDQESALDEIFNAKKNQVIEGDVKKSTEFAESAESIGLETKAFKSTQDFEAGIEADGIKLDDEQRSELGEVGGFISGNKIYINEQVAAETNNLNVGGHEVMHGVVTEKLKTLNPEQLQQLQKDFLELLPSTEKQLLQDALNERYDTKDHAKEFFSVFSDLSQNGDIKYNETVFTKIRDWLVEMIRRFTPYKKIEFNNAQDVYTFMREYTNSINKGRLSKGLAKGIGKVDPAGIAFSKQASDNVQNIYNERGVDGSFDIIEAFNPIINKLVDKRRDAPNFNKEDLTSEIKYSDRGILGLIRSYKPDSGIPLAAYVNKFLPSRMIEASNKILGEEFTLDVTEAKGVVAQEAETVTEKPVSKKIKPSSLLKDIETAKSKIMEGLKNIPKKDLTFKRLKDLSPETTAEIFEVPVKKVTDPKANLNKSDLSNAARNINKNADKLLRLLPKGAVVEAASEKLLGTSTGVPKSLLDVFYTKQERLTRGAGLSPYKLNSINRQQFLEGLGIVDGKLREGLSPRSPEAQRIKAVMNLTGKLITNEIVRTESDLSLEAKQDIAAGKADVMFSKTVARQKDEYADRTKSFNDYQIRNGKKVSKADPALKNEIKETIVPELKKLPKEIKVSLLYTMQGTGRDKLDGTLGRSGMIYPNIAEARKALGLSEAEVKEITSQPDFKDSMQYAGKSVLSTSQLSIETINQILTDTNLQKTIARENQAKLDRLNSIITELANLVAKKPELADGINHILGLQSDYQGHFIRKYVPFVSFTSPKILGNKKIHDEHYSKSLRTTRFTQSIIKKAALAKEIYIKNELKDDLEDLNAGMARGIVSKIEGNRFDEKKGIGEQSFISETPFVEVYTKLENPKLHFVLPFTRLNPTDKIKSLQEIADANFKLVNNNNKLLPPKEKISFSKKKPVDNKEVINKLEEIDQVNIDASKARAAEADINKEFNQYLESATGIGAEKVFNQAKAEARGSKVKKSFGDYFIPPGAEDFSGLMHKTLAKGKKGEKQLEFYKKYLYDPYNAAIESITREKSAMMNDFMALKKQFSNVPKRLKKFTKGGDYTNDQAVRVYAWTRQGMEIPGLSKKDVRELVNEVKNDKELLAFATELINITKGDGYPKPQESWVGGNVAIDLMSLLNGDKRSKHLEAWQNNVNILFSKENMFKLEAAYGKNWVKNVKATLERMKNGSNRKWGGDKNIQAWNDWVNGSVGTIMFLNTRSAALQMISNVNYINYKDNNPLRAAQAFANQPQYWSDFVEIFNSDYLQERRGGNKININESELALAAEKGGVQGTISYLLNKGFILTKMADSFAIASGGATMYRNRIKTYVKDGMSEADAKKQAFLDFKAITEETQQSSRPDRISEQQASGLGRFMLAFANTPMQYNRIIKRNAQDLFARRGDPKEKMSKILYYSTIQNFIFNAMSKAVFALAFADDDDDEKVVSKAAQVGEGMAESLLRGSGLTGNAVVAVKNVVKELAKQAGKPNPKFEDVVLKGFTVSPPLYGKVTRLRGAGYAMKYVTPENIFEPKLDNPALSAAAQTASATFNFPLDRALRKAQNIEAAMSNEPEWWQRAALLAGWGSWELGMENEKDKKEKKIKPFGKKFGKTFGKKF